MLVVYQCFIGQSHKKRYTYSFHIDWNQSEFVFSYIFVIFQKCFSDLFQFRYIYSYIKSNRDVAFPYADFIIY